MIEFHLNTYDNDGNLIYDISIEDCEFVDHITEFNPSTFSPENPIVNEQYILNLTSFLNNKSSAISHFILYAKVKNIG